MRSCLMGPGYVKFSNLRPCRFNQDRLGRRGDMATNTLEGSCSFFKPTADFKPISKFKNSSHSLDFLLVPCGEPDIPPYNTRPSCHAVSNPTKMSNVPQAPAFGLLRLASLRDMPRIGVVATAGFRYSPAFVWGRTYHDKFFGDTLASYRNSFTKLILDPKYIVLVAEDEYDPRRANKDTCEASRN